MEHTTKVSDEDLATAPEDRRSTQDEQEKPGLDEEFEDVTEGEKIESTEKLKSKWAALGALVGTQARLALVARDIVDHFEQRLVLNALPLDRRATLRVGRLPFEGGDELTALRGRLAGAYDWSTPSSSRGDSTRGGRREHRSGV